MVGKESTVISWIILVALFWTFSSISISLTKLGFENCIQYSNSGLTFELYILVIISWDLHSTVPVYTIGAPDSRVFVIRFNTEWAGSWKISCLIPDNSIICSLNMKLIKLWITVLFFYISYILRIAMHVYYMFVYW